MISNNTAALLMITVMGGCDTLGKTDEPPAPSEQPPAASTTPKYTNYDTIPLQPGPTLNAGILQQSSDVLVAGDTGISATQLELAQLAASMEVPVHGVARDQLRDSYTEPRGGRVHEAMDILAPRGTPVVSAVDGRLLKLFNSKAGGLMVYATDDSQRFILLYGHLDSYVAGLTNGMQLKRGQTIGYVGTTGNAPVGTPHLHFGILRGRPNVSWSKGAPVNPFLLYVPAKVPTL